MQINVSGGKSGQLTEDYILSGTCIFPPPFHSLPLYVYDRVIRVVVRISVLLFVHIFLRASLNK